MTTTAKTYGALTVLAVEPALTQQEGGEFRRVASEQVRAGGRWFILDLARAAYFDGPGLEDLLAFQEEVAAAGGAVKVAALKGGARTIFEMVRFDRKFDVFDSVHEAVKSFA